MVGSRSNRWRSIHWIQPIVYTVLLGVAVACSGGGAPSGILYAAPPAQAPTPSPSTGPTPSSGGDLASAGPLINMVFASSVDAKGQLVNPRFTFPLDEPQITAVVQVGQLAHLKSPLSITWFLLNDDGTEKKLFEHTIDVQSRDRAYSRIKNPGALGDTLYRVTASLEGTTRQTRVATRTKKGNSAISLPLSNPSDLPADGGSGKVPQSAQAPTGQPPASADCSYASLRPNNVSSNNTDYDMDTVVVTAGLQCSQPQAVLKVDATVNGSSQGVGYLYPDGNQFKETNFYINPCVHPGGSDLPGTQIKVHGTLQNARAENTGLDGLDATITIGDDTEAPFLAASSVPDKGTKVKPGDKIEVYVQAEEDFLGSWQTGVHSIQVTANPGGMVGEAWTNPDRLPQPCDRKTWNKKLVPVTYTVPDNPPPAILLCAIADDYMGNESSKCAAFPTVDDCLTSPGKEMGVGAPCIQGTQETVYNATIVNGRFTDFVLNPLSAHFYLWSVGPGQLKGQAHLSVHHFSTHQDSDPRSNCPYNTVTGSPVEWDVSLNGQFFKMPDGSVQILFQATPPQSPPWVMQPDACGGPVPQPGVHWTGLSGKLVGGVFDRRQENPLPANGTGEFYTIIHIEQLRPRSH